MTLRKSLAWSFSQEFIQKGVRIAGSIMIARLLTPDEVGVFSIAMAANFLLNSVREFGVGTYLIREPELTYDKVRTVFGLTLLIQWTLGAALLLLRFPIADLYGQPGIADVLALVAITFFFAPFGQPAIALLRRDMRFDQLHHIGTAEVLVGTGTGVWLATLGYSYMALAWGLLASTVTRVALTLAARRDHLRLRPGLRHWREVLQFGGWLTVAGLFGTIAVEGRKLVLGGIINPGTVALYERAQMIPQMSRQTLFMPVGRVLLPSFSKNVREGVSIGPGVEMYVAATTAIIWPAFLTIGFIAVPVTVLLFGDNWRTAGEILPYILGSAAIVAALPQPEQVLTPHGAVRRLAAIRFVQVTGALSFAALGSLHSLELFAALLIPTAAVFSLAVYLSIRSMMGTGLRRLAPFYAKAAILSAPCAAPAFWAYIEYGNSLPIGPLLAAAGSAVPIWFAGLFILRHPLSGEIAPMVAWLHSRVKPPK
ncbi:hypothetical protein CKO28_24220 [Rhodovibrio sodomensis]|uniref:Polysaccharide biosynthesis protein n=1 Tax=Rhodovibrio sodomensis TaxID=1088 RepID=A0ABS1DKR3_9PROT|nr:hypothetical protein [Rhodovibrio sodomensis]